MIKGLLRKFQKPTRKRRTQAQRMLTLRRVPVYYLPITKCGSTYLKNLFYYLDHSVEHVSGIDIHSNADDLVRAQTGDEEAIRQSPYAFAVLRDPVDRFLSLYFDKIYGDGPNNFTDVRAYLADEISLDLARGLNVETHRDNCKKLINWVSLNLDHKTDVPINPHWRRQSSRLQRVKSLELQHLTLDGLDWQLPELLGDIIPDIRQAMSAVKSDNRTEKPFSRIEILDGALLEKIEATYVTDNALYERATYKWQPWLKFYPEIDEGDKLICLSPENHPIRYVATPKVGCTYLRNLLYILEHNEAYDNPLAIHVSAERTQSEATRIEIIKDVSFFVVRDPVARFFSLYFDKIYGSEGREFSWVTKRLIQHRGYIDGSDLSIDQHRHNSNALLEYIERKFATETLSEQNPHWAPQCEVAKKAIRFGMQPLLLEDLDKQLIQIAAGRIEGLEAAMEAVPLRNHTIKPFTLDEILTTEIAQRISTLYAADQALYERVKTAWRETGQPPIL